MSEPQATITATGWTEGDKPISIIFVLPEVFSPVAIWLHVSEKMGFDRDFRHCPRCRKAFQHDQNVFQMMTDDGNRVICHECHSALLAAGFPTDWPAKKE